MIQVGMKLNIASRRLISKYRDGKEKKKKENAHKKHPKQQE